MFHKISIQNLHVEISKCCRFFQQKTKEKFKLHFKTILDQNERQNIYMNRPRWIDLYISMHSSGTKLRTGQHVLILVLSIILKEGFIFGIASISNKYVFYQLFSIYDPTRYMGRNISPTHCFAHRRHTIPIFRNISDMPIFRNVLRQYKQTKPPINR